MGSTARIKRLIRKTCVITTLTALAWQISFTASALSKPLYTEKKDTNNKHTITTSSELSTHSELSTSTELAAKPQVSQNEVNEKSGPTTNATSGKATLNIAVLYSTPGHRSFFEGLRAQFEQHFPNIDLKFTGLVDESYKQALIPWLEQGEMDILYWQAGERLHNLARRDLLLPITSFWSQENLDQAFDVNVRNAVSYQQEVYGLPFAFYTWGLFYNKPLLSKLSIAPPKNWADLLELCEKVSSTNKVPLMIGSGDPWLPAAWFDYIDLRLNGLAFHQALLAGKISYTDERVKAVFAHWQQLIEAKCFNLGHQYIKWRDALPPLYRQMTAMTLLGNFLDNHIPKHLEKDIGFLPFPVINPEVKQYENVPMDVFVIAKNTKHPTLAKQFLKFVADANVQSAIATAIGQSAPHRDAKQAQGYFAQLNKPLLNQAHGLGQYFDRDVNQAMVDESLIVFAEFLRNPDVSRATKQLEALRLAMYAGADKGLTAK